MISTPPKPLFKKEDIVAAALDIVREKGIDALTARELASRLGSSPRPIFTVFASMDDVKQRVCEAALELYGTYYEKTSRYVLEFKRIGMQMTLFALHEPRIYQMLFMKAQTGAKSFTDIFNWMGDYGSNALFTLTDSTGLEQSQSMELFRHIWIYTYGICALVSTGMCDFSEEEIADMLTREFTALSASIKKQGE